MDSWLQLSYQPSTNRKIIKLIGKYTNAYGVCRVTDIPDRKLFIAELSSILLQDGYFLDHSVQPCVTLYVSDFSPVSSISSLAPSSRITKCSYV